MVKTCVVPSRRVIVSSIAIASLGLVGALLACGGTQRPDGGEGLLGKGQPAPELSAVDQNGVPRSVGGQQPQWLLVYFYPKDDTPGCTTEACAFRDAWALYDEAGIMIYGVSSDDAESHAEFAEEHDLPFPLIPDPDGTWARAFGVGSTLGFDDRVSFLIDPEGIVVAQYPDVDPGIHATEVLKDVERLRGGR